MNIRVPRDARSSAVASSSIARRVPAGQKALVTGAARHVDGGMMLHPGFEAGG